MGLLDWAPSFMSEEISSNLGRPRFWIMVAIMFGWVRVICMIQVNLRILDGSDGFGCGVCFASLGLHLSYLEREGFSS